jgi:hypothetical protein
MKNEGWAMKSIMMIIVAVGVASAGFGLNWPSGDATQLSNFGSNNEGEAQTGDIFASAGEVHTAGEGEIIFFSNNDKNASRLPSTLGVWAAVDHGDGLLSIYGRLDEDTKPGPDMVYPFTVLALAGKSGAAGSAGFYFSFFDRKERRYVNSEMLLPPFTDKLPPVIRQISLISAEGAANGNGIATAASINLAQARTIPQGRYKICVDAPDTRLDTAERFLAPFRVVVSINGVESGSLSFETVQARDGAQMLYRNGLVSVKQIFAPYPAYEVAEVWFTRGIVSLDIMVYDISGNSRTATYRLVIE